MNGSEELNDSAVLSAVRDAISRASLPAAPHLEAITARARARRRRHLGGLSLAGAGACAALVAGLAGSGFAVPAPQHAAGEASRHRATQVHLAAFSIVTGPGGATTLTLHPGQVINPGAVRRALAEHGIPALVTAGKFCHTADRPPGAGRAVKATGVPLPAGPSLTLVIHRSALPSGAMLSIGYRQGTQNGDQLREISFTLIQAGGPLTCTSIPDKARQGL